MNPTPILRPEEEQALLVIARSALREHLCFEKRLSTDGLDLPAALRAPRGAFVTLRNGAELRGCIGSTSHSTSLVETVINSVLRSAANDPRFSPVTDNELEVMGIEISVLGDGDEASSPFIRVKDVNQLVIGRDGLYIEGLKNVSGLLLPQVATDRGWDAPEFLRALCQKANLPDGCWNDEGSKLYRFTAQVFSETSYRSIRS